MFIACLPSSAIYIMPEFCIHRWFPIVIRFHKVDLFYILKVTGASSDFTVRLLCQVMPVHLHQAAVRLQKLHICNLSLSQ